LKELAGSKLAMTSWDCFGSFSRMLTRNDCVNL